MNKRKHWEFSPDHVVSFGKHRGMKYRELPDDYLRWFAENGYGQMANRKAWAMKEIARRKAITSIRLVTEVNGEGTAERVVKVM